jgi:hypothetical protein
VGPLDVEATISPEDLKLQNDGVNFMFRSL